MSGGFFMLVPLLIVHLTQNLHFDATVAGIILGARMVIHQGLAPFSGAISDRLGYKPAIIGGLVVRASGFLMFGFAVDIPGILIAVLVTSLGGAMFDPPARASLAYLTTEQDRQAAYSASGAASWIGQAVGPLIGSILLPLSFFWVSLAAAIGFFLAAAQAIFFVPSGMRGESQNEPFLSSVGAPLKDRDYMKLVGCLFLFYLVGIQMLIGVPLLADRISGPTSIGLLFAIQAAIGMVLQVPAVRFASKHLPPLTIMSLASIIVGVGFGGFAFATDFWGLVVCTVIAAIGNLFINPAVSVITARLGGGRGGAYFGIGALAVGFGGGIGNVAGGALIDAGIRMGIPWLPWAVLAALAVAASLGFFSLSRQPRLLSRLNRAPA